MKHTPEQMDKWIRIMQLMHAFGELEPEKVATIERIIQGWKWETFTCTKSEAFAEVTRLAEEIGLTPGMTIGANNPSNHERELV